jgi:hypothetical protein
MTGYCHGVGSILLLLLLIHAGTARIKAWTDLLYRIVKTSFREAIEVLGWRILPVTKCLSSQRNARKHRGIQIRDVSARATYDCVSLIQQPPAAYVSKEK